MAGKSEHAALLWRRSNIALLPEKASGVAFSSKPELASRLKLAEVSFGMATQTRRCAYTSNRSRTYTAAASFGRLSTSAMGPKINNSPLPPSAFQGCSAERRIVASCEAMTKNSRLFQSYPACASAPCPERIHRQRNPSSIKMISPATLVAIENIKRRVIPAE